MPEIHQNGYVGSNTIGQNLECWFFSQRGKTGVVGEKPRSKGVNQQQTQPTQNMASTLGFEPWPHWSEATDSLLRHPMLS